MCRQKGVHSTGKSKALKPYPEHFPEQAELLVQKDEARVEVIVTAEDQNPVRVVAWLIPRLPTPLQQLQGFLPDALMGN